MIRAFPTHRNRVIVSNSIRNQQFLGVNWFGDTDRPSFVLVRIRTGEQPMPVQGYELLGHERQHAAYGDKALFRYALDSGINKSSELLFPSFLPTMGAGLLALWLVRKSGEQLTYQDTLKIKQFILDQPEVLNEWCRLERDLFNPDNQGYRVIAEPPPAVLRTLLNAATQT